MKVSLTLFFLLLIYDITFCQGPGSGRTLNFSGTSNTQAVDIPDSDLYTVASLTVEAWVYPTTPQFEVIFSKGETNGTREYYLALLATGEIRVAIFDNTSTDYLATSTAKVNYNLWNHIAFTYDFTTAQVVIYLNGVNVGSTTFSIHVAMQNTSIHPLIGGLWDPTNGGYRYNYAGYIDEVRVWNNVHTLTEIRDNMCQTLSGSNTNLVGYYQLDEISGTSTSDASGNGLNGTLINFSVGQIASRFYSGAPIGNQSTYLYPASWTGLSLILASTPPPGIDEGSMTIDNITGSPTGFHLYRVDATPSQTGGLSNPIDKYFGTFIVNGTSPTYRATYDYSGTIFDNFQCEPHYRLFQRNDNSVATWSLLTNALDISANTLIASNNTARKEIILDTTCNGDLPVIFSFFEVNKDGDDRIVLNWKLDFTESIKFFEIERSVDNINFQNIDEVKNESFLSHFTYIDDQISNERYYYRIKSLDLNGEIYYSQIRVVNLDYAFRIFPNPGDGFFTLESKGNEIDRVVVYDNYGNEQYSIFKEEIPSTDSLKIDLSYLPKGVYYLVLYSESGIDTEKLIIE